MRLTLTIIMLMFVSNVFHKCIHWVEFNLSIGNNEHSRILVAVVQGTLPEPERFRSATQTACFNIVSFDRIKCTRLNAKEFRSCLY